MVGHPASGQNASRAARWVAAGFGACHSSRGFWAQPSALPARHRQYAFFQSGQRRQQTLFASALLRNARSLPARRPRVYDQPGATQREVASQNLAAPLRIHRRTWLERCLFAETHLPLRLVFDINGCQLYRNLPYGRRGRSDSKVGTT